MTLQVVKLVENKADIILVNAAQSKMRDRDNTSDEYDGLKANGTLTGRKR